MECEDIIVDSMDSEDQEALSVDPVKEFMNPDPTVPEVSAADSTQTQDKFTESEDEIHSPDGFEDDGPGIEVVDSTTNGPEILDTETMDVNVDSEETTDKSMSQCDITMLSTLANMASKQNDSAIKSSILENSVLSVQQEEKSEMGDEEKHVTLGGKPEESEQRLGEPEEKLDSVEGLNETEERLDESEDKLDEIKTLPVKMEEKSDDHVKSEEGETEAREEGAVGGTDNKHSDNWHNVGIFTTNKTIISDYFSAVEPDAPIDLAKLLQQTGQRIELEPGTAYKIRVCAVNACGAGPWSEVAAFKTTLPGFPGAPSSIKINKSHEGVHLTWEPPTVNCGKILGYAVYLAVRGPQAAQIQPQATSATSSQLSFVRVFCGPTNRCTIGNTSLQAAHLDMSTKPAIIFRIAARNDKGYGPATQVRWLQDSPQPAPASGTKRRVQRDV